MSYIPDSVETESTHPIEDDSESPVFGSGSDVFAPKSDPIYGFESNGETVFVETILPPPSEMQEQGFALREWRRQNALVIEEKEKKEKEILTQILEEANDYKVAFHEKRKITCESNKTNNREKEQVFVTNQEEFHKEVDKDYWKSIAELIPNEVPVIKKRGTKDQEKKPSVVVIQGPKPGKPADLARMRQILVKLKHSTPAHLKLEPSPATTETKDSEPAAVAASPEAVMAA